MPPSRLSYEDSCRRLQKDYLGPGEIPPQPDRLPMPDDEEPGVSFFRTFVGEGDDLSNLTLPRTFFGRSEINDAQFRNTDFTESNLCWNDFTDVDFSDAILAGSDLRASNFTRVRFRSTDLAGVDLRRSSFEDCEFGGASMAGAVLTREQGMRLSLSAEQRAQIAWTDDDGPEPGSGGERALASASQTAAVGSSAAVQGKALMEGEEVDRRALIAAVEESRMRQRFAKGGALAVAMCLGVANTLAPHKPAAATVLTWAAPVVLVALSVPFWLVRCPKCRRRYHSFRSMFRDVDEPGPCASCGFDIGAHLPRYGRPRFDE